tara:strand:+ start:1463 stop:1645 length:183 start_codon:yes stop_codon:yes gene_type:complete
MSDVEKRITAAVREADSVFEKTGGSTRHYVRECLMPILEKNGLEVREKPRDDSGECDASQ